MQKQEKLTGTSQAPCALSSARMGSKLGRCLRPVPQNQHSVPGSSIWGLESRVGGGI